MQYTKKDKKFISKTFPKMCADTQFIHAVNPAKKKVIVMGDIHGDMQLALDMLQGARLIKIKNNVVRWIGGETYVVQVGDQIDRCRPSVGLPCDNPLTTPNDEASDILILNLFNDLNVQAQKVGGMVVSLLGNHELMNVQGNMNYVSYKGLKQFEDMRDPQNPTKKFKNGLEARKHFFKPGNVYGKLLGCTRVPCLIIGSNLFVHAGIVDGLIEEIKMKGVHDLEKINIKIRKWLLGLMNSKKINKLVGYSEKSMFWTRLLGDIPPNKSHRVPECRNNISDVMKLFRIGSMIIGHTPQSFKYSQDINSTCSGMVWRVDNGASHAFDKFDSVLTGKSNSRRPQWLKIKNDKKFYVCDKTTTKSVDY